MFTCHQEQDLVNCVQPIPIQVQMEYNVFVDLDINFKVEFVYQAVQVNLYQILKEYAYAQQEEFC